MNLNPEAMNNMLHNFGAVTGIGAMVVLVASCWRYVVIFFNGVRNAIFSRSIYKNEASVAVLSYIFNNAKKIKFGMRSYAGTRHYVNPVKRVEVIAYEDITDEPMFIWLDGRPMVIKRSSSDQKVATTQTAYYDDNIVENPIELITLRGLVDLDKLVVRAVEYYNQKHRGNKGGATDQKRFSVKRLGRASSGEAAPGRRRAPMGGNLYIDQIEQYIRNQNLRLLNWKTEDIGLRKTHNSAFNVFFYPASVMRLVDEIRCWLKYEDWFKDKGIPWRLGCLFYGKPGTGKSTLIRSIAMEMDLPVFIIDLTSMDNTTLGEAWEEIQQNAPAIALIEDIDSVFNLRENVSATNVMRDSLTYDCLLNTISGVKNSDGVLLCITTNDLTKLDDALGVPTADVTSTRPGRIDRAIELIDMQQEERVKVAEYILKDTDADIQKVIAEGQGETAAQFQTRCTSIALAHFWKTNKLS